MEIEPLQKQSVNTRSTPSLLDGMFWVRIADDIDPLDFCNKLLQYPQVVYAEVVMQEHLFAVPNDPLAQPGGNQGYLQVIKAYDAWEITTGSPDIKIAIIDTGMDLNHEDLTSKYYVNTGESPEPNGIDDDGNGYIDDYRGYDFADDDPNAQADGSQHGTHVGGVAGAATNNSTGIAGVGYNTPISALKGFTTVGTQGIGLWPAVLYAAQNDFDVANLSWGGVGNYSQFLQDVISYCVLEKNMVIVAAAGNTNADLDFYPASYEHVLSVAGTTLTDTKWSSGTYSHHVDLTAPAQSIFSTQNNNTYNSDSGSSHAAPQVAGAAALVKSVFGQYNARQIMEQLRVTSDDIYGVGTNSNFAYKMGKGRLNVFRAVNETNSRSLRVQNFTYDNGFGAFAFYGDTISMQFDLTNYLAGLNAPAIQVMSSSPYVSLSGSSIQPGNFQTMETKSMSNLKLVLAENTPPNTEIDLLFLMEDGSYSDFQNVTFLSNPNNVDYASDDLTLKVAGDGSLCYLDAAYTNGFSMMYKSQSVLPYAGLLVATDAANMQDNVTNSFGTTKSRDDDFQSLKNMKLMPHAVLPYYGYSEFGSKNGNFRVEQSIIPSESDSYVILSYRIINTTATTLTNLHTGFFADYLLANTTNNRAVWDEHANALVLMDNVESTFAALKLLDESYRYAALNMQAMNGNMRDIQDAFTNAEKFDWLTGANKQTAGTVGDGNDVAGLAGKSFLNVPSGESVEVSFVLAMADSYSELVTTLQAAADAHDRFKAHPPILETIYACESGDVLVNPVTGVQYSFFQDAQATTFLSTGTSFTLKDIQDDSVIYVKNRDGAFVSAIQQIRIKVLEQIGNFSASKDTLYLDHPTINTLTFTDQSFKPTAWNWDFGNGTGATTPQPTVNYTQAGTYEVTLRVQTEIGCADEVTKEIVVANRPASPVLAPLFLCQHETVELIHPTEEYVVYNASNQRIAKGAAMVLGPFSQHTTLHIAQRINGFESLPVDVGVAVDPLVAAFSVSPDLNSESIRAIFTHIGQTADSYNWTINGQSVSTSNQFSYSINGTPLELQLTVSNANCEDVRTETISFNPSPTPRVENVSVCVGEDAVILPSNGTFFAFYADQALTQLLGKGTHFVRPEVTQNQTVYVVGLDNILPGAVAQATISVESFETAIVANPSQLVLQVSGVAQFSSSNALIASARWFVNDEFIEAALSPTILFTTPGLYEVKLIAENVLGCSTETVLNYEVVASLPTSVETIKTTIYPNPALRGGLLHLSQTYPSIHLISLDGKEVFELRDTDCFSIPATIEPGVYILSLMSSNSRQLIKLLIQ